MSGVVAVVAGELGRWSQFSISYANLLVPDGAVREWQLGVSISAGRNLAAEKMLARTDSEWLWFIDDDMSFGPDVLLRLLARDVDVVGGLYMQRTRMMRPEAWVEIGDGSFQDVPLTAGPGLRRVARIGCGAMLIRRRVLEALEPPWFEIRHPVTGTVGEDESFCDRARAAGFGVFVDFDVTFGHIGGSVVAPIVDADGCSIAVTVGGQTIVLGPLTHLDAERLG